MTKVVFRESLVMQKMSGSGCDDDSCLCTHLQADFAKVSDKTDQPKKEERTLVLVLVLVRDGATLKIDKFDIIRDVDKLLKLVFIFVFFFCFFFHFF